MNEILSIFSDFNWSFGFEGKYKLSISSISWIKDFSVFNISINSTFCISFSSLFIPSNDNSSHFWKFNSFFITGFINKLSKYSIIFSGLLISNKLILSWLFICISLSIGFSKEIWILSIFSSLISGFCIWGIHILSFSSIWLIGFVKPDISNLSIIWAKFSGYLILSKEILSTNLVLNSFFSFTFWGIKISSLFSITFSNFSFDSFSIVRLSNFCTNKTFFFLYKRTKLSPFWILFSSFCFFKIIILSISCILLSPYWIDSPMI